MAGRIMAEDITSIKERASIEDVVREHVTLRRAGASLKGLCPFHDEKTPSFTVNPTTGYYQCYGCGEGGDVFAFLQKVEHLTFTEAVERLASKVGVQVRFEEGGGRRDDHASPGRRARLLEAHRVAQEFYAAYLLGAPAARAGRDFMRARGFDGAVATRFGVGFAPRGGEELARHLRSKGFNDDEVVLAGLVGRGSRGLYDRFRGRLVWPIRDITGDVVGFGARRIFDDDRIEAKYLNTSETPIYKKSTVLYGLDSAKKAISTTRTAVVVEGYTDVMACHLAGVETAVATCGTAFGVEHIKVLRRIMRDEADLAPARVIFTFDGDAAGQAAAMKAFKEDQRWASQSFVAVAPGGKDPCDLRLTDGDDAVRHLVEDAVPMFEFAVRTTIARFDLDTAEGRVQALKAAAPIVAGIRDSAARPEYTRTVAGWLGVEIEQLADEIKRAGKREAAQGSSGPGGPGGGAPNGAGGPGPRQYADPPDSAIEPSAGELAAALPPPNLRDPVVVAERQLLQCLLQYPSVADPLSLSLLSAGDFSAPAHERVFETIATVGITPATSVTAWREAIHEAAPASVKALVVDLSVAGLPTILDPSTGAPTRRFVDALFSRLREVALRRQIADALGQLRREETAAEPDLTRQRELSLHLQDLQRQLAMMLDREDS
ncbi:MAG: DNA primase [Dermatophilaceae bacterium]|nr:DNA primase [Dermatophilaceae bacterium]MBP9917124.1 DNA primase [Dermatophilaceae bacterium]